MTEPDRDLQGPLEETPEAAAAVEDEGTVPQLATGDREVDRDTVTFQAPDQVPAERGTTEDVIGDPMGGGTPGAGQARTGAEQPWEPEDLVAARGQDVTPERLERARQDLAQEGPTAIEKTIP